MQERRSTAQPILHNVCLAVWADCRASRLQVPWGFDCYVKGNTGELACVGVGVGVPVCYFDYYYLQSHGAPEPQSCFVVSLLVPVLSTQWHCESVCSPFAALTL